MNRIERIRLKEKEYHDHCYENMRLFEQGSWLHKPVKTVMDLLSVFDHKGEVNVLDLGCGVGRNSIPIAQRLENRAGKVVCVDLLDSAISNLSIYGNIYGVSNRLETHISDIGNFDIPPHIYDFIFSVSSIEHLNSEASFDDVLQRMIVGTKAGGVNCIIISTNVTETDITTGRQLEPMYELLFETNELIDKFIRWLGVNETYR